MNSCIVTNGYACTYGNEHKSVECDVEVIGNYCKEKKHVYVREKDQQDGHFS